MTVMHEERSFAPTLGSAPAGPAMYLEPPLPAVAPGAIVDGRYRLLREIGAGGGGVVFEAEHVHTGARVALKTLSRGADSSRRAEWLLREAHILGSIRHPNVVRVLDAGECARHGKFVAMALIQGRTLESFVATRGRLDVGSVVAVIDQLANALMALDMRGIVHGDIKPSNVLVSRGTCGEPDHVVLIDFGVAKQTESARAPADQELPDSDVVGTPEYMAPEQLSARGDVDHRADVYGLGALAYECLTGTTPFLGPPLVVMSSIAAGARPAPIADLREDIPPALASAITRALEAQPAQRWPNAASFARACAGAILGIPRLYLYSQEHTRVDSASSGRCRRQTTRAPYRAPGRLLLDAGAAVDCRVEDISPTGLLVISGSDVHPESMLSVKFPLPMSGQVVKLRAVVRWARPHPKGHAAGLELCEVPLDVRREIEVYLTPFGGTVSI